MDQLIYFFGSLAVFLALGIPISLVLVLCSIVLMFAGGMWDVMTIPNIMVDGANNYPLMAIPFFVFAGEIMAAGGLSKRVVDLAQLLIGRVKGGLGYAAIIASIIFAGLMGSSVGEAAALGGLLLPMMKRVGYDPGRAGGIIASSIELKWPQPTRPGDVLRVESEVLEITPSKSRPERAIVTTRSETLNQRDEVVQSTVAKLVAHRRP